MFANDLTRAVLEMTPAEVDQLLELFAQEEMQITRAPRSGLIMMTVTDSFEADFHLGEVLVTEATVRVAGCEGAGTVLGEEPRKALARAAADALLRSGRNDETCGWVRACLERAGARQKVRRAEETALTASTRVNFDLMPGA